MAKSCCVDGCIAKNVVYFRFPNSRTQCKKWIESIKLTGKPSYNSVICSDHFRPDDYGLVRGKVRLKAKVVPISQNEQQKPNQTTQNKDADKENTESPDNQNTSRNSCREKEEKSEEEKNNSIEGISNGHGEEDKGDTGDEDDQPLSKQTTRDSMKKLSESINQVDLNADNDLSMEKDIEDMLTYYSIKQNKAVADRQTEELNREQQRECERLQSEENGEENVVDLSTQETEPEPVFIEVAVNEEQNNRESGSPRDCLMLLESVQVELDPNELMMSDVDDSAAGGNQPEEPISLLTSSDEDDVILEEPHIDTVEVSDATDEDDVPLVKLVPKTPKLRPRRRAPNPFYRKDGWGTYQYFCPQCDYRTPSKAEYQAHTVQHSTAVLVCRRCAYTTSSKAQYTRHMRRHSDRRRYKCHLCSYKAKHQMSLVYHLKCHESVGDQCNVFKCDKCDYVSSVKRYLTRHTLLCSGRKTRSKSKAKYRYENKKRSNRSQMEKLKKKRSQFGSEGSVWQEKWYHCPMASSKARPNGNFSRTSNLNRSLRSM